MFMHALLALSLATPTMVLRALPQSATSASSTVAAARRATGTPPRARRADPHKRTMFGAAIAPVSEIMRGMQYLHADEGVLLTAVQPGGAAEAAGLRSGDVLLAVNGKHVDETTLYGTLRAETRNHAFRIEYLREGKWKDTWATIEQ